MDVDADGIISRCRKVVEDHQSEKINGVFMDTQSAHTLITVYDAMSEKTRVKLVEMLDNKGIVSTVGFVWKLVERIQSRTKAAS